MPFSHLNISIGRIDHGNDINREFYIFFEHYTNIIFIEIIILEKMYK
jgi:hypothetical protein